MSIAELPSRAGTIEMVREEIHRLAVPGGFSPDLVFIKLDDLVRQEQRKGIDRVMEKNMLRYLRLYGLTGDMYLFIRSKGNGWPGQPIGLPVVLPNGSGDDFFCGVYMPGFEEKEEDAQNIMAVLHEVEDVPIPEGMKRHFVDGFLVVTRQVVNNWKQEKRIFFEPAQMNSPLHSLDRMIERRDVATEIGRELMREQAMWALRAVGMLELRHLTSLATDRNKPFREGKAVNLALWPYINPDYSHLGPWLLDRDPSCVFEGSTVGDLKLDRCDRPLPMGSFDTIHPNARRMSVERSGANLHHILPRKGLILEMYNFIIRNNIPPDFDPQDLIKILSYVNHGEYMDMTNKENARLHADMREVDRNMVKYAKLMEATMNEPQNMVRVCQECHYGPIHYDTPYQYSVAAVLNEVENGRIKIKTDEGFSKGNVEEIADRIVSEIGRTSGMKSADAFKWLQLSRLLVAETGHLFVHVQTANLMLRVAASRTGRLNHAHRREQIVEVVKSANGSANGSGKYDLRTGIDNALHSKSFPVPTRRIKSVKPAGVKE